MELILALLCEEARERPDGRLDFLGVFDELAAPGFPAKQDRLVAVFILEWSPAEAGQQPLRADLVTPAGDRVLSIQGHTDVALGVTGGPAPRTRLVMPLEEVPFPVPGRYRFRIEAGGRTVEACPLTLRQLPAPDPHPG
jgi:hypothetical protein